MPLIEPPGRFLVRVAEDHFGVLAVRFPAEMVRDAILAAVFHRFLPVSVLSDASTSHDVMWGEVLSEAFRMGVPPGSLQIFTVGRGHSGRFRRVLGRFGPR